MCTMYIQNAMDNHLKKLFLKIYFVPLKDSKTSTKIR